MITYTGTAGPATLWMVPAGATVVSRSSMQLSIWFSFNMLTGMASASLRMIG